MNQHIVEHASFLLQEVDILNDEIVIDTSLATISYENFMAFISQIKVLDSSKQIEMDVNRLSSIIQCEFVI
jgi:hypothetical protein